MKIDEGWIKSIMTILVVSLLAIWLANNVREIGNLVRPRQISGS